MGVFGVREKCFWAEEGTPYFIKESYSTVIGTAGSALIRNNIDPITESLITTCMIKESCLDLIDQCYVEPYILSLII